MNRETIPNNVKRKLWADCAGYCQNPQCNEYLLVVIKDKVVSLADIAHIIGYSENGPRSEHELAQIIEKNGSSNLLMLCLECHKIVDELEQHFTVEQMMMWKTLHLQRIESLFSVPIFENELELLKEVNDLLDENKSIFESYGPFSKSALEGDSGDAQLVWKRRCLDTIIPNNKRIIDIFERNKRKFGYPWEAYRKMLVYKVHADSFRDNCLLSEKVNDYKLFPVEFEHFVKSRVGVQIDSLEMREQEDIEYRSDTVSVFINRFLASHSAISYMEKLNKYIFEVYLFDGRTLKVFTTNTYYFTEYTFGKIIAIDPYIDAIVCSSPYCSYSHNAKVLCIQNNIGLFMLKEFMGAINTRGDKFLNYLLHEEKQSRVQNFADDLKKSKILNGNCNVYLFGSFLRRKVYNDIDLAIVYQNNLPTSKVDSLLNEIRDIFKHNSHLFDFIVCSNDEFAKLVFQDSNVVKVL